MNVDQLLERACQGDSRARGELIRATYDQLRALAAAHMRDERPDHTLTATALVHEVSLQLLEGTAVTANNRGQFLALAAKAMRNLLIDHARTRGRKNAAAACRNCRSMSLWRRATSGTRSWSTWTKRSNDSAKSTRGRLRLSSCGISAVCRSRKRRKSSSVSPATVKRDWEVARAWLLRELQRENERVQ